MSTDCVTCPYCGSNLYPDEVCDCKIPHCKICGKILKWGKFAYMQEVCWDCYKEKLLKCVDILFDLGRVEESSMIFHAGCCISELFEEDFP